MPEIIASSNPEIELAEACLVGARMTSDEISKKISRLGNAVQIFCQTAFDADEHRAIVRVAGQLRTRLAPIFVDPRDARRKINYGGRAAPPPRI